MISGGKGKNNYWYFQMFWGNCFWGAMGSGTFAPRPQIGQTRSRIVQARVDHDSQKIEGTDTWVIAAVIPKCLSQWLTKKALSHEIFLQKEWFSQILFVPLPRHWWFCLFWFCSTKISEKSDMTKSWAARLSLLPQQELFVAQVLIKNVKLKCCGF